MLVMVTNQISIEFTFAAAHQVRGHGGQCENLHGHNWRTEISVVRDGLDALGMVMDFADLKRITNEIIERDYDHKFLNEDTKTFRAGSGGVNPTAENIAHDLFDKVSAQLPENVCMDYVRVWESPGYSALCRQV